MHIGQEQQILVEVGELEFCIDLNEVLSIISPPKMVRLPAARGAFTRAFKYLDELGAAVSMRAKFELDEREDMQSGQLLLGRINERLAGFWFDKVVGIHKLGEDMHVYDDMHKLRLPVSEIDQLFVYKQRLIPHITLSGLLRFEQASEWKQWLQTEKLEIEHALSEAKLAEQARIDAIKEHKAAEESAREAKHQELPPSRPLLVEELYALMDEAGIGPVINEPEPLEAEAGVTNGPGGEAETAFETQTSTEAAASVEDAVELSPLEPQPQETATSPDSDEDQALSLAVPVDPEPVNSLIHNLVESHSETASETEADEDQSEDDAIFALEKKSEAYRQRMDAEQQVELKEYQIIKVGDRGWRRWLRRWLRRLLLTGLLLLLLMLAVVSNDYVRLYGDPVERVYIQTEAGEVDWAASYAAGSTELKRYGLYVVEVAQQRWMSPSE